MKPLDSQDETRGFLDAWADNLAQVLESMTDQRPQIKWRAVTGSVADTGLGAEANLIWWEQTLKCPEPLQLWVAAPQITCDHAGSVTLKAAGLDSGGPAELKSTWLEILGQWLSSFALALGNRLGHEVPRDASSEHAAPESTRDWILLSLSFPDVELPPIGVGFSAGLAEILRVRHAPDAHKPADLVSARVPSADGSSFPASPTLDLLLDVELPVSISFGKTQLCLQDVLKLTTGSIVELNRAIDEPVEILVNHCLVARGEVVVVDGNYGIRIQQIASRSDRLRSLR